VARRLVPLLAAAALVTGAGEPPPGGSSPSGASENPAEGAAPETLQALAPLRPPGGRLPCIPEAIALDPLGRLFVLDRASGRIFRRDLDGTWLDFSPGGQGGSRLPQLTALFAGSGPDLYGLDATAGLLYRFDLEGRLRAAIDWSAGLEEGRSFVPADLALSASGELLLLDRTGGRLLLFDRDGRPIGDLASGLAGPQRPRAPTGLAIDGAGTIHVLDPPSRRVWRVSRQGAALPDWPYAEAGEDPVLAVRGDSTAVVISRRGDRAVPLPRRGSAPVTWVPSTPPRYPVADAVAAGDSLLYLACPGQGEVLRWRMPGARHDEPATGP